MKRSLWRGVLLLGAMAVALLASWAEAVPSATISNKKVVETYRASSTLVFDLASEEEQEETGETYSSSGELVLNSLKFEAGARSFNGTTVDLSGRESDFSGLFSRFSSQAVTGSSVVIQGTATGATSDASLSSSFTGQGVQFSVSQLKTGDTFTGVGSAGTWTSNVAPALKGANLTYSSTYTVTSVDPVNGIVAVTCSGSIEAEAPATSTGVGGTVAGAALLFMAFGVGTGRLFMRRDSAS